MKEVILEGHKIPYKVRESKKARHARIEVGPEGVSVVLPIRAKLKPEDLLKEKSSWIIKKHKAISERMSKMPVRVIEEGGTLPYLGSEHTVKLTEGEQGFKNNELLIPRKKMEHKELEDIVEGMYREKARELFLKIIEKHKHHVNNEHNRIYIRNQSTKWGSCSSKHNLNFNWRLIMAPERIVEYVVVHELVHLDIQNHSKEFWSKLEGILPDHRESKRWLKENGAFLVFGVQDNSKL